MINFMRDQGVSKLMPVVDPDKEYEVKYYFLAYYIRRMPMSNVQCVYNLVDKIGVLSVVWSEYQTCKQ